jgi:sugar phosphate isomerase/epimerase
MDDTMPETSRRAFLSAAALAPSLARSAAPPTATKQDAPLKLGVASYSLREFSRKLAIKMTRQLDTPYINVKEFHLLYRSTPEEIAKGVKDFKSAGLTITGGGTISLQKDDDDDVRKYFEYAKAAGMPLMVVAPMAKTLPRIERFVKEYDIKVAIHNHGPEDKHFPAPQDALKLIKGMDPRMGLCIDAGHTVRTGADVVESVREAGSRLLDMHMKDLRDLKDKDSQCIVGEGAIPVPALFRELVKMNYQGHVMLEYEIDADDPLPGMQRSFAYMRGVLAGMKA